MNTTALIGLILAVVAVAIGLEQLTAWIWPPGALPICF
jgi:hypothetical protein